MNKKRFLWAFLAILLIGTLVLSACQPATEEPTEPAMEEPTEPPTEVEPFKAGMVTDVGGVDDKSFNAASWEGLQRAEENIDNFEAQVLESDQQTDYAPNIQQLIDQNTDLIVTVGFLLGEDTQTFAADNPETLFAIVDYAYEEPSANLKGITFSTDEAAFLAGYLSAGMTETGKVGMFGGLEIPTVTIFMDGFAAGVNYYNEQKGANVEVLGRNLFVGNFESTEDGRNTGQTLIDEGADIIMPVAGPVGLGTAAVAQENEGVKVIWVDTDGCVSAAEYCNVFLSSVMKNMSNAVLDVAEKATAGETENWSTPYDGTLANNGVGIAPYHEYEEQVPDELKAEIDELRQMIIDGELSPAGEVMEATPTPEEAAAEIDCMGAQEGDTVSMLYQWSGGEEEDIMEILKPVVDACGIELQPESTRDQALLDTRVQAGTPPDIAFWNVTQLEQYQDILVPLTDLGVHGDNYPDFWKSIGTVGDTWLGLPVKADPKTLTWYSPVNFEAFGYEVPETWDELDALVEQMVADGNTPWSMGFESGDATGWTGTDFVQDILLVNQGPDYVNGILDGSIPYNDEGVKEAWQIYGEWAMSDEYTVGGAQGTLSTGFNEAILKVFSDPPEAMMVKQSGFAGGTITEQYTDFEYGTDYDFFGVPGAQGLQGGSDWMMMFSDKPAVKAVVAYLSSDAGGQKWAKVGFDLTPNSAGAGAYTNEALQKKADILANASGFVPDIGDSIPGGFGSAEFSAISDFVNGAELDPLLDNLAEIQQEALSE